MASDRAVFMRPVIVDSTNKDVTVGGFVVALTTGVYPNVAAVMYELQVKVIAAGIATFTATLNTSLKVVLAATPNFAVVWTDTALRDLLGFTGNLADTNTYTATYTPQNTWFPLRVRADNDEWYQDHKVQWKGTTARNGNSVGLRTGSAIYSTSIEYNALPDYECLRARSTTAFQDVRCLDYFLDQSREIYSAYNQVSAAGFYYFPDYTAVTIGACATYTSGDCTQFHRSSSPSTFAFCAFDSNYYPQYKPTWSAGQCEFYNCDVNIHTATAPTWTGA